MPDLKPHSTTSNYAKVMVTVAFLLLALFGGTMHLSPSGIVLAQEIVIDAVLASVDGVPITLREFNAKVAPDRRLTLAEVKQDDTLKSALESIIMERLIEAEANTRKIKASDQDVERYLNEIAAQNNLDRSNFETALAAQGKSLVEYKRQVRLDILRSKIMAQLAQSAPAVSDDEIKEQAGDGPNDTLRYVLKALIVKGDVDSLEERASKVQEALSSGEDPASLESVDGSVTLESLGEVAEDDLSEDIKDAVSSLEAGEVSEAVTSEDRVSFFILERRLEPGEVVESEATKQLRKSMEQRKLEEKFQKFFLEEMPKNHKVERKY